MTTDDARHLLTVAGLFDAEGEDAALRQTLCCNDTWGWATAWGEYVPDEELPEVARLFVAYGWCGVLYWISERHGQMRSEFDDVNRCVQFVRNEEARKTHHAESDGSPAR